MKNKSEFTIDSLKQLNFKPFVAGFRAESAALWLLCFYILIEWISPHRMYPVLDILPWGQASILCCFASIFVTNSRAIGFSAMDKSFIVFYTIVILSIIFAWSTSESLRWWTTVASWVLLYFSVVSILTTPQRMLLFVIFFLLINLKLSQHGARSFAMRGFTFASYGLTGSPGWFRNSGEYTLQMVVVFSISLSLLLAFKEYMKGMKRWWVLMLLFPGTAAMTIVGGSSRGGQLAFLAVLLYYLLRGPRFFLKIFLITFFSYVILNFLPPAQMERFNSMGEDKTSVKRLEHWEHAMDTIDKNPWGIGYRNWIPYYYENYRPPALEQIHNTVLEAFVDVGYPGGILFIIMIITALVMNARTAKEMNAIGGVEGKSMAAIAVGVSLGLLGTFISALFMSVLFYPMFWLAFAMTSALRNISKQKSNST